MDMSGGHMHDMGGMAPPATNGTGTMVRHGMMMHMTFFWGKNAQILFRYWPGDNTGMYVLALVFVFVLSVLVEWLSHTRLTKPGSNNLVAGLVQTVLHAFRIGLAYLVMLALMSFNVGVFLVAVAGHALGFFIFGSRAFRKTQNDKSFDHPPFSC